MEENKDKATGKGEPDNLADRAADILDNVERSGIISTGKQFLRSLGRLFGNGEEETTKD
ncbi:MAG: hypothetical protein PHO67_08030 [Candidatus Omnitrophica bacterium]|nr:hypothetical protein [Candidatus Omnitrophota bacterium]